jgi:hypothetical protein
MGRYIDLHVAGDPKHLRKTTPIATGSTHDARRSLCLDRLAPNGSAKADIACGRRSLEIAAPGPRPDARRDRP